VLERKTRILLNEQDRHAVVAEHFQRREDLGDDSGREAE